MIIKGKLKFISLFSPIEVGGTDLRGEIWNLFEQLKDKPVSMNCSMDSIIIKSDKKSETTLEYRNEGDTMRILLRKTDGFGFSNLCAYLPDMLERLNGMEVIVHITKTKLSFEHNPIDNPFELKYTHGNSCSVSDEDVKNICKVGQGDCCIFLTVGGQGFSCEKFNSSMSRYLLDRFEKGETRARRIGNCKIVGRIENEKD